MKLSTAISLLTMALLAILSQTAFAQAGTSPQLPEPDVLALLAIGGAALAVAKWRKRRK